MARPILIGGTYYLKRRVPADLVPVLGKTQVKISLRTKDPAEARRLHAAQAAATQAHWDVLRKGPNSLDDRQIEAIAGEVYRALLSKVPGGSRNAFVNHSFAGVRWVLEMALGYCPVPNGGSIDAWQTLESVLGPYVDAAVADRLVLDETTRYRVLEKAAEAAIQATKQTLRECAGDWRPDPDANRFPDKETIPCLDPKKSPDKANVFAKAVNGRGMKTTIKYKRIFDSLMAFARTDDTSMITADTIKNWRDDLLTQPGLSPRTVARDYLGTVKAILNCAVRTECLKDNPAAGISVEEARLVKPRKMRSFTNEEVTTILKASLHPVSGQAKLRASKRWVPWLCAYTGARVNEMTQVRRGDVRRRDGHWCVVITADAGTQKTGETHDVPIHEHLIAQGFLEFVASHRMGEALFYNPRPAGVERKTFPAESTGKALALWVRSLGITDLAVDPNHGWRHRFKTDGRAAGLDAHVLDALQGHAIAGMNGRYGEFPARVTSQGIAKFPRFDPDATFQTAEEEIL